MSELKNLSGDEGKKKIGELIKSVRILYDDHRGQGRLF